MDYSAANTAVWNPVVQCGILAATILLANLLRRKVGFIRRMMMPTAVLGGFILLILKITGLIRVDPVFMEGITYHCIAIGFIATSLRIPSRNEEDRGNLVGLRSGAIIVGSYMIQAVMGLTISILLGYTLIPSLFKAELITDLKRRAQAQQMAAATAAMGGAPGGPAQGDPPAVTMGSSGPDAPGGLVASGPEDEDKKISSMPTNIQKDFNRLPGKAKNALLRVQPGMN